jgi:hypothetical protein
VREDCSIKNSAQTDSEECQRGKAKISNTLKSIAPERTWFAPNDDGDLLRNLNARWQP